jgi:hypothetical protein
LWVSFGSGGLVAVGGFRIQWRFPVAASLIWRAIVLLVCSITIFLFLQLCGRRSFLGLGARSDEFITGGRPSDSRFWDWVIRECRLGRRLFLPSGWGMAGRLREPDMGRFVVAMPSQR